MATARIALGLVACLFLVDEQSASAQGYSFYPRRYQVDQHNQVIRDSYGHVIGGYRQNVIREMPNQVVPGVSRIDNHGSYVIRNGKYFFTPNSGDFGTAPQLQTIQFGSFSHVDDLASQLETEMKYFLLDMHYNYAHNHGFRTTYAEAYRLYEVAKYIHAAEHQQNRAAIRQQLGGMDALFHHLEEDVETWTRHNHYPVGHLGIRAKMNQIESTLHHLMNDVGVELAPPAPAINDPPVPLN